MQLLQKLIEQLSEKWLSILISLALMAAGWWIGRWRARSAWKKKEFFDRVNISLNSLQDGKLLIRTILEKKCEDVFLNKAATETILSEAKSTTEQMPLIPLPKDEYWYFLNAVLNEVAEAFSTGTIKRDLGVTTSGSTYLISLTNECAGEMRTRKLRAMLIQKETLANLPDKCPALASPHHITRWETLQCMAREYQSNPWKFLEMEIAV